MIHSPEDLELIIQERRLLLQRLSVENVDAAEQLKESVVSMAQKNMRLRDQQVKLERLGADVNSKRAVKALKDQELEELLRKKREHLLVYGEGSQSEEMPPQEEVLERVNARVAHLEKSSTSLERTIQERLVRVAAQDKRIEELQRAIQEQKKQLELSSKIKANEIFEDASYELGVHP